MKKLWKVLGAAALVAAVVPYKMEDDLLSGEKTVDALLWQLKLRRREDDTVEKEINILPCRRRAKAERDEAELFEDEEWMYGPASLEVEEDPCGDLPF